MDVTSRFGRGCAVLVVGALLLLFLGPTLDHHYAERQFGHSHISLGTEQAGHLHFYEDAQGHSHDHHADLAALMLDGDEWVPPPDGVVFLTTTDSIGYVFAGLSGLLADLEYDARGLGDVSMLGIIGNDAVQIGAFVPRPKKPPRI